MAEAYNEAIGRRLRAIRGQKGLSLQQVEELSGQEFKASVVGAYERGERSLSLPRMQRLAEFYGVPVDQLLPPSDRSPGQGIPITSNGGVVIDLTALDELDGPNAVLVERFLRAIQLMRQDFNGKVLTIRHADLELLSRILEDEGQTIGDVLSPISVTP
jgi:transcriptional regulator with XRE-family HTH domain